MSDTLSISSNQSDAGGGSPAHKSSLVNLVVEEVGQFSDDDFCCQPPRRLALLECTLVALSGDGQRLMLAELRTRGGDDWTLAAKSVVQLPTRHLDVTLVPNQGGASAVFLAEKGRERVLTAHHLRLKGRNILTLEQPEFTCYDKVNVLGKGVSLICADPSAPEPTVYSAGGLIRKLRLEDGGSSLRPTPARAQVPVEGQDGALALSAQGASKGGGGSITVAAAFKTKSAGRNKFLVEWFTCNNKKDELICSKSAIRLGEETEPVALLQDPKDARLGYLLTINRTSGTSALYKCSKGRKLEDPLATFPFEAGAAAIGACGDGSATLLIYDAGQCLARVYSVHKTDGFRTRHPACARCPALEALPAQAHILSCAGTSKWRLTAAQVDVVLGSIQLTLVTLLDARGACVREPESGLHFRLRVLACPVQNQSAITLALDDLERQFDGAEDVLAQCTLKLCLSVPPDRDGLSLLSAWLMGGRLAAVEVASVEGGGGGDSDRLVLKAISAERFRGFLTDIDWTQQPSHQRQGTFTLDQNDGKNKIRHSSTTTGHKSAGNGEVLKATSDLEDAIFKVKVNEESLRESVAALYEKLEELKANPRRNDSE